MSHPEIHVALVGAGPGDAGLLTLRGAELLRRAEVVLYDGLVNEDLLKLAPASAEIIYAGKHDRTRCVSQEELNALLLECALKGKRVVRLKGGDPYLFGRGGEEAEVLAQAGVPFEVVPGVSSIHAVPCYAGIPLTHREHVSSYTVITGHEDPFSAHNKHDWKLLAQLPGTLVVLMGLKHLRAITEALALHGRSPKTPVAVISKGTTGQQRAVTGTLEDIADLVELEHIPAPAVTVIGEVVQLREALNWFEHRSLFGKRVVLTQRADLAQPAVRAFQEQGAEVLEIPATRWVPHPDTKTLDNALRNLQAYDWILFSNPCGIDFFFQRLLTLHGDLRALGPARLGAYGPRCGEKLRAWHVQPAAVSADHKNPLILEAVLRCGDVRGKRFLILRGEEATEQVPEALCELGATVDVICSYAVEPETEAEKRDGLKIRPTIEKLMQEGADWIVFASGLAIEHFHHRFNLPELLARFPQMRVAITTPTIQWAVNKLGVECSLTTETIYVDSLLAGIIAQSCEPRKDPERTLVPEYCPA